MSKTLHNEKSTKECILCGRCLEVCPLFRATAREELSPRAKHQLASGMAKGALRALSAKELAALCLGCGRCEGACPQGLCVPDVIAEMRRAHPGLQEWLWQTWMGAGRALWPALSRLAGLAPSWLPGEVRARGLEAMRSKFLIEPWLELERSEQPTVAESPENVAIFPGCLASTVRRDWTAKAGELLRARGISPLPEPDWACCGCTLGHAGLLERQLRSRVRNIEVWRQAGRPRIAVFCATCRCGLMAYARDLDLPWQPGEQLAWQQAVTPLASFLLPPAKEGGVRIVEDKAPVRVHFHRPCHGGGHGGGHGGAGQSGAQGGKGSGGADLSFLRLAAGERVSAPDMGQCCGMGGILQLGAPGLSRQVAASCWGVYGAAPGDQLLTACSGCVAQLSATAPEGVVVGHWLDAVSVAGK